MYTMWKLAVSTVILVLSTCCLWTNAFVAPIGFARPTASLVVGRHHERLKCNVVHDRVHHSGRRVGANPGEGPLVEYEYYSVAFTLNPVWRVLLCRTSSIDPVRLFSWYCSRFWPVEHYGRHMKMSVSQHVLVHDNYRVEILAIVTMFFGD